MFSPTWPVRRPQPHAAKIFDSDENLALERSWVHASEQSFDCRNEIFLDNVYVTFQEQPEFNRERTAGSLERRCRVIKRISQKYIAAEKLYRSKIPSGEKESETLDNIMELYRDKNKVHGKLAAVTSFMGALRLFSAFPR